MAKFDILVYLYARYLWSRDALGLKAEQPLGRARDDRISCKHVVYHYSRASSKGGIQHRLSQTQAEISRFNLSAHPSRKQTIYST